MSFNPFNLQKKNILITGAGSGIGRQTAINCSKMGASCILLGRDQYKLEKTINECENLENHSILSIDFAKEENIVKNIEEHLTDAGKIDGFVHSAGVSPTLPLKGLTEKKFNEVINVNLKAGIQLAQWVTKKKNLPEDGQSIVFISSVMSEVGEPGKALYGMTKGGLVSATKSLAVELAPKNIRVNCISPGVVKTPMSLSSEYSKDDTSFQKMRDMHPLDLGHPDDIANSCIYLLSDSARWITGTNLIVDGGYTAR